MDPYSGEYLDTLRRAELELVVDLFPPGARVLEIGAGRGHQAALLSSNGFEIEAIDLPSGQERVFPVRDYDGREIPFPDGSFDVVFSSNALEHVRDLTSMHQEIRRALRPGGTCIHVLPSAVWRAASLATAIPKAVVMASRARSPLYGIRYAGAQQRRHGERGISGFSELWLFRSVWWRNHFREHGFRLIEDRPVGLFYTANALLGPLVSIERRAALARLGGSATHVFKLSTS